MTTQPATPGLLQDSGSIMALGGLLLGAIGGFYRAQAQRDALKSQASAAEFQENIAAINARAAERDAQSILRAGADENQVLTLRQGQERGQLRAQQAGRGLTVGQGSAADVERGQRIQHLIERMTLRSNTVRRANAARSRAVDFRNQGLLAGVQSENLRGSARTVSPASNTIRSLLDGGSRLALQYNAARRS